VDGDSSEEGGNGEVASQSSHSRPSLATAASWKPAARWSKQQNTIPVNVPTPALVAPATACTAIDPARSAGKPYTPVEIAGKAIVSTAY